ncbi:hypothetical protein EVAR_44743_1 [Eumeta japonica]|uniref:Uncharacterized protein n=1 Tax=Eumeta variegata TaxID=151549 RepID=A0A4C1XH58_EUMVA|nr:hypothetical protein EVAR_44743_1 [Eumeta japonica]
MDTHSPSKVRSALPASWVAITWCEEGEQSNGRRNWMTGEWATETRTQESLSTVPSSISHNFVQIWELDDVGEVFRTGESEKPDFKPVPVAGRWRYRVAPPPRPTWPNTLNSDDDVLSVCLLYVSASGDNAIFSYTAMNKVQAGALCMCERSPFCVYGCKTKAVRAVNLKHRQVGWPRRRVAPRAHAGARTRARRAAASFTYAGVREGRHRAPGDRAPGRENGARERDERTIIGGGKKRKVGGGITL